MKAVVYIGNNSEGKTRKLCSVMERFSIDEYVTNMFDKVYSSYGYDLVSIEAICVDLCCDYEILQNNDLIFKGEGITAKLNYLLTLLSSKARYIFLDEPENGLSSREVLDFLIAINSLVETEKIIYITTHEPNYTSVLGAEVFLINAGEETLLKWGEDIEKMDSFRG